MSYFYRATESVSEIIVSKLQRAKVIIWSGRLYVDGNFVSGGLFNRFASNALSSGRLMGESRDENNAGLFLYVALIVLSFHNKQFLSFLLLVLVFRFRICSGY